MLDTDTDTLRIQARLMKGLSPDERLRRVLSWSAELLQCSRQNWMGCGAARDGEGAEDAATSKDARLEAWLRAQHGDDIAPGFAAAREAWLRRRGLGV